MTTSSQPVTLTELKITIELRDLINQAYDSGLPMVMAHVDPQGRPGMSYRGSVIVFSETQLGLWARSGTGGTVQAIGGNPNVTLIYREADPEGGRSRSLITFRGRARVDDSEAARRRVYDEMPQRERDYDPEMKGVAILVDLDSISGKMPGFILEMAR
jgi:hypothetical protein